ncbi:uncharacterized protein LOC143036136 [Oratosquilla oratoria]|uniref:uncharacterized protein LOC143036136 n=1 Tax=Oratosquilla oratoria TaxID=337810 RepID=UPI003F769E94
MGSPLEGVMANFFMGSIEEVFRKTEKPDIYCRYIDDIFIKTKNTSEAEKLRLLLQETSDLTFTLEDNVDGALPFLDILVKQTEHSFNAEFYTKLTKPERCLNGSGECRQRYKDSTIGGYIRRALTHYKFEGDRTVENNHKKR